MKNILFIILPIIFTTSVFATESKDLTIPETAKIFEETIETINEEYIGEYTNRQLLDSALYGMTYNLDSYSYYLSEDYINENYSTSEISYQIGVDLIYDNNKYFISKIQNNSPITNFDVKVGDEVIALNQYAISDLTEEEINDILYVEPDKIKSIKLVRDNKVMSYDIAFEYLQTVFLKSQDDEIVIQIKEFQPTSAYELKTILSKIKNLSSKNIIIDLRDNGGGYVSSLNEILNLLIPEQETFTILYKDGKKDVFYTDGTNYKYKKLALLINENTASCAEVFAGVVKNSGLGTLIGNKTYGKGVSQDISPINVESIDYIGAIKMTTGLIFIDEKSFDKIGIEPDIKVTLPKFVVKESEYYYESLGTTFDDNISLILSLGNYSSLKDFKKDNNLNYDDVLDMKTIETLNTYRETLLNENDFQLNKALEIL